MRISDWSSDVCSSDLQFGGIQGADVDAIEIDAAALRVVEAQQHREHGALARAGRPDQRHGFAGRDVQAEVFQCRCVGSRWVVEGDALEAQFSAYRDRQDRKSTRLNFQSLMRISYADFWLQKKK